VPGEPRYVESIQKLVATLDLKDRVEMLGWVDDTQQLFENATIGVQSSHHEGLSLTLLEQMMAGLAIVATNVGDTSFAIRDRETGLLIAPKSDSQLTDALRECLDSRPLREELGQNAARVALENFSDRSMAQRVLNLLDAGNG